MAHASVPAIQPTSLCSLSYSVLSVPTVSRYRPRRSGKFPSPPNSPWQRSNSTYFSYKSHPWRTPQSPQSSQPLCALSLTLCSLCFALFSRPLRRLLPHLRRHSQRPNRQRPPAPPPLHLCGGAAGCYLWSRLQLIVIPGLAATLILRCGSKTGRSENGQDVEGGKTPEPDDTRTARDAQLRRRAHPH